MGKTDDLDEDELEQLEEEEGRRLAATDNNFRGRGRKLVQAVASKSDPRL